MTSQPKQSIGCFTADFRGNKVAVGGKAFSAGFFFCNSLNEYWREAPKGEYSKPDGGWLIANRLISAHQPMWKAVFPPAAWGWDEFVFHGILLA